MNEKEQNDIRIFGKVALMPKNVKASHAFNFLEKIKISKQKLWYILIEKQDDELQMIKYNNKSGYNLMILIENLKNYYEVDDNMKEYIDKIEIDGNDKFSIIKNIPNIEIKGKKLISILTEDLIKLLK